jgi:hypothetical protein
VFAGGYGGWLEEDPRFDGLRSQSDVWASEDGLNWTMVTSSASFGGLAWFGMAVWDVKQTATSIPRMWIVGGGYVGDAGNKRVNTISASVSVYWSTMGADWTMSNFRLGGGTSELNLYSSNEWTKSDIDGEELYLGLWGLTLETFKKTGEDSTVCFLL